MAACPGSCPRWQSLELSGSCLPFLRPGWPSSACQPPWWSLSDIQYNLLGAVRPTHISPLTSLPRCLLKSWRRLHALPCGAAAGAELGLSVKTLGAVTSLSLGEERRGAGRATLRQIIFPTSIRITHTLQAALSNLDCGFVACIQLQMCPPRKNNFTSGCTECIMEVLPLQMCPCHRRGACARSWVCLRETERVRGCVCFHLLHNREWRQSVLPRLPHYSGSSVGVRERPQLASALFHNQDYFWLRHSQEKTKNKNHHVMLQRERETRREWWRRLCQVEGVCCQISSATEWTMRRASAVGLKWMTTTISCARVFVSSCVDHSGVDDKSRGAVSPRGVEFSEVVEVVVFSPL